MYPERSSIVTSSTKARACSEQDLGEPEEPVPQGDLFWRDWAWTPRTAFSHSDRTLRKPENEYTSMVRHCWHWHFLSVQGHCLPLLSMDKDWKSEVWLECKLVSKDEERGGWFSLDFSKGSSVVKASKGSVLSSLASKWESCLSFVPCSAVTKTSELILPFASAWVLCFSWSLAFILQYVNLGGCSTGDLERLRRGALADPLEGFRMHLQGWNRWASR